MYHFKVFLIAAVVLFITDMIWLGFIAKSFYFKEYAWVLRLQDGKLLPIWWATALVYVALASALTIFVLPQAQGNLVHALIYGAIMGAIIYGVYDFTCVAIFKSWPIPISFIDWAWGTFLCGFSSWVTAYFSKLL